MHKLAQIQTGYKRRANHYANIAVINNDDTFLSSISEKKYNWFISKELATEVNCPDGFEKAIKLNFLVKNPRILKSNLAPVENRCVICGTRDKLTQHHVVPFFIKKFFPVSEKARTSHWCVLTCRECHNNAEKFIRNSPTIPKFNHITVKENLSTFKKFGYVSSYNALIKHRVLKMLKTEKLKELEDIIIDYGLDLKSFPLTSGQLNQIKIESRLIIREKNAFKIKKWIDSFESVQDIYKLFRDIFMQTEPKFLPEGFLET